MSIPARRRVDAAAAPNAAASPRRRPALHLASARRADGRVVTFDASGQQVSDTDGLKRVLQTKKHAAIHVSPDTTPANSHDPLKQIVTVVDDKNHTTRVAYDHLGRRTRIDNPDTGKTETVYDTASNVIAKITANLRSVGQQVTYAYDFNRLKAIEYPA